MAGGKGAYFRPGCGPPLAEVGSRKSSICYAVIFTTHTVSQLPEETLSNKNALILIQLAFEVKYNFAY